MADVSPITRIDCRKMSQEEALRRFDYDAETGKLRWKYAPDKDAAWNGRYAGRVAGTEATGATGKRYCYVGHGKGRACAHRLIWVMHFGEIPPGIQIDHLDGDGTNNRLENLRLVTRAGNNRNMRLRSSNTSGVPGVRWRERDKRYIVYGSTGGRYVHLGHFTDIDSAVARRKQWERENDYHPNHGTNRPL